MFEVGLGGAQRVRADDEVLVGVQGPARPDHVVELVVIAREAVLEQDGVVFGGVQLAVGDVRHPEVVDDPAPLELQFAELGHLVRRLTRPMGMRRRD